MSYSLLLFIYDFLSFQNLVPSKVVFTNETNVIHTLECFKTILLNYQVFKSIFMKIYKDKS